MTVIGVPREVKQNERRVGMTPDGVKRLTSMGVNVVVSSGAGVYAGFSDDEYVSAGATIECMICNVYEQSDIIVKVKEPQPDEVDLITSKHTLFCYLHLAPNKRLTQALLNKRCKAIAYETIVVDGKTPLLAPMSDVAGRVAVQRGATFMSKLLSGVTGVPRAHVMVVGAGIVGRAATETAIGMGARVTVVDRSVAVLSAFERSGVMCDTLHTGTITGDMLRDVDMLVGAVHVPGHKATCVATIEAISHMKPGSVVADVSIDQGGCFEGSEPTTHDNPTYTLGSAPGVLYYCVPNLPAAVPHTSTRALCNATLPFVEELVAPGRVFEVKYEQSVNVCNGTICNDAVREAFYR